MNVYLFTPPFFLRTFLEVVFTFLTSTHHYMEKPILSAFLISFPIFSWGGEEVSQKMSLA